MKTSGANRCLLIATTSLFMALMMATWPLAGLAQEEAQAPAPQRRYVSDKLVLNVYAESDQSGGRVATIQTGDSVDELERSGNMVRVRLDDGREGWVGANYLTSDAPAAVRLRELQRDQRSSTPTPTPAPAEPDKKSLEEIARLKKENAALQGQVGELQSRVATLGSMAEGAPTEPPAEEAVSDEPEAEVMDEPVQTTTVVTLGPTWWMWLIAVVLTGALGYVSGYQTLARRLRKKFGGLRIY